MQVDYGDWTDQNAGRIGILLAPLRWQNTDRGHETSVDIETGFMSDGATVPQFLWGFLPPWGDRSTIAALFHDHICDLLKAGTPAPNCETREKCDGQYLAIFLWAQPKMKWRARLAWLGVRWYSIFVEKLK